MTTATMMTMTKTVNKIEKIEVLTLLKIAVWVCLGYSTCAEAANSRHKKELFDGDTVQQACGFSALSELKSEAEKTLNTFASIKDMDPFFWEEDPKKHDDEKRSAVEKAKQIESMKKQYEVNLPFGKTLFDIQAKLVSKIELKNLAGFLKLNFDTTCAIACIQGVFVGLNAASFQILYERNGNSFEKMASFIIAHEMAHDVTISTIGTQIHSIQLKDIGKTTKPSATANFTSRSMLSPCY